MTDDQIAEELKTAVQALNAATARAVKKGLSVDISVVTQATMRVGDVDNVVARISRAL